MGLLTILQNVYFNYFVPFILLLTLYLVVVSTLGITSGISRFYVRVLMYIFEVRVEVFFIIIIVITFFCYHNLFLY